MRVLDLFCCQGGAGAGYAQAGHEIVGVDINPKFKRHYPFYFVCADAIDYLKNNHEKFDFIHASPPCQGYSNLTPHYAKERHDKLIAKLRDTLLDIGKPYCIENVAGARHELRDPLMLCGTMFGLRTQRHRYFETSFDIDAPFGCNHKQLPLLVTTASKASIKLRKSLGMKPKTVKNAPLAYGIGWMTFDGLKECIPPAYTKYIIERFVAT